MIAVVVPAHEEEATIGPCLDALRVAAAHPDLRGEGVEIIVVLDACRDGTHQVARARGAHCIEVEARNVGVARAAGASASIVRGARWLAFTDADSEVDPDWLARQVDTVVDAVCGVIRVKDWSGYGAEARACYEAGYVDADHHRHVHGASLGVSTTAYVRAGGFPPLRCSEDVELVRRLGAQGATIRWTNAVRVATSARRVARAPGGFSAHLRQVEEAVKKRDGIAR